MNSKLFFITFIILIATVSCKQKKTILSNNLSKADSISDYKNIAFKKYGADTIFFKSPKANYFLCKKKLSNPIQNPNELLFFFVYDIKNKKIIYEDKISSAKVSWKSDYELYITKQLGIIKSPEDKGGIEYIYNLKTKKKQEINSNTDKK